EMQKSHARFIDIFGAPPVTHGAAGWQMNDAAFEQIDAWGMRYASDGRGHSPYLPVVGGRTLSHVQMPTTLPTLDEVLGIDG
ncbi:4-deoxy-4-formamido-L-arabinose-phosphoundecaprenol deformylase, partial [Burkholderia sp. SIMBA_042]